MHIQHKEESSIGKKGVKAGWEGGGIGYWGSLYSKTWNNWVHPSQSLASPASQSTSDSLLAVSLSPLAPKQGLLFIASRLHERQNTFSHSYLQNSFYVLRTVQGKGSFHTHCMCCQKDWYWPYHQLCVCDLEGDWVDLMRSLNFC